MLNGHPLYTFAEDSSAGTAKGQGLKGFGGTWEVLSASGSGLTAAALKGIPQAAPRAARQWLSGRRLVLADPHD